MFLVRKACISLFRTFSETFYYFVREWTARDCKTSGKAAKKKMLFWRIFTSTVTEKQGVSCGLFHLLCHLNDICVCVYSQKTLYIHGLYSRWFSVRLCWIRDQTGTTSRRQQGVSEVLHKPQMLLEICVCTKHIVRHWFYIFIIIILVLLIKVSENPWAVTVQGVTVLQFLWGKLVWRSCVISSS